VSLISFSLSLSAAHTDSEEGKQAQKGCASKFYHVTQKSFQLHGENPEWDEVRGGLEPGAELYLPGFGGGKNDYPEFTRIIDSKG
jgi:hypothetical protein